MNTILVIIFELFFLITLPYTILIFTPFEDVLRFSKKKVALILLIFAACHIFILVFFSTSTYTLKFAWIIYSIFLTLSSFLVFTLTVKANVYNMLYVFFMVTSYTISVLNIVRFLVAKFHPSLYYAEYSVASIFAQFIALFVTYPFIFLFFKKKIKPIIGNMNHAIWKPMCLIPLLFFAINVLYSGAYPLEQVVKTQFIFFTITIFVVSLLVYFFTLKTLTQSQENMLLKINVAERSRQLLLQKEYYGFLQNHVEETKQSKQALKQHIDTLFNFLNTKDYSGLTNYLATYTQGLHLDSDITLCENKAINMLLSYYLRLSKKFHIEVAISGNIKENLSIPDSDLCVILGNLFENAIEASSKVTDESPFITLNFSNLHHQLFIIADNNFTGDIKMKEGYFLSGKREGFGIGTTSIKTIVAKHNGFVTFNHEAQRFMVSISLPLEKGSGDQK